MKFRLASLERNLFFTYSFVAAGNLLNSCLFIRRFGYNTHEIVGLVSV